MLSFGLQWGTTQCLFPEEEEEARDGPSSPEEEEESQTEIKTKRTFAD